MPLYLEGSPKIVWHRLVLLTRKFLPTEQVGAEAAGVMVMDLAKGLVGLVAFREMLTDGAVEGDQSSLCGFQINITPTWERLDCPPHQTLLIVDDERELVIQLRFSDGQVMMVDERIETADPPATGANVQHCEGQARRLYHANDYSYEALLRLVCATWCSMTLLKNVSTEIHVDSHNERDSRTTTTVTFGSFSGGQL